MDLVYPKLLVVMALEQEDAGAFIRADIPVHYTGCGKINATFSLTRRLAAYVSAARELPVVVNFGTAGGKSRYVGHNVECTTFIQRDMDATALGCAPGATPYDSVPHELRVAAAVERLPAVVCGTGDSFATANSFSDIDVVDMEAFALAKVCFLYGSRFVCVKHVTDGADSEAAESWQANVSRAGRDYVDLYQEIAAKLPAR
jgi:adenosylhomocysteine nucleosidase